MDPSSVSASHTAGTGPSLHLVCFGRREHWLVAVQREFEIASDPLPNLESLSAIRQRRDMLESLCDQACMNLARQHSHDWNC